MVKKVRPAAKIAVRPPTVRSLALAMGLSHTTVADALRGNPWVKKDTALFVRNFAEKAGYRRNSLAGMVMSMHRNSTRRQKCATLVVVDSVAGENLVPDGYCDALFDGIAIRAQDLGFKAERFVLGAGGNSIEHLDLVLGRRAIQGIVFLPSCAGLNRAMLQWPHYAAVCIDNGLENLLLDSVGPDYHASMGILLRELHARGYRRPGLFLSEPPKENIKSRWEVALLAQCGLLSAGKSVPPLRFSRGDDKQFKRWFGAHLPDVVLGDHPEALNWIRDMGWEVPRKYGFVCLNYRKGNGSHSALNLRAEQIGRRAASQVISQISQNQFGLPEHPSITNIPAAIWEGDTLH